MVKTVVGLQRRLAQKGEIRIGYSEQATSRAGKAFQRPVKADTIRMTTLDEKVARLMSRHYDCPEPALWTPQGGGAAKWLVDTGLKEVDVMVPPFEGTFSQFYERWNGGECDRRCDGAVLTGPERLRGKPCICGEEGQRSKDPRFCKLTTRVSFMLPWLRSGGTWLLVTHGWNAGQDLPGMVELMQSAQAYQLGRLSLVPRNDRKDGQARHWYEPRLDLATDGPMTAAELTGAKPLALAAPAVPAIEADDEPEVIEAEFVDTTPEPAPSAPAPAPKTSAPAPSAATDGKHEAWAACLQAAGTKGLTTTQVLKEYRTALGKSPSDSTVEDYRQFLAHLTGAAA
jgi:hypothetical protein